MRLLFLTLLLANVAAFGYIVYAEGRAGGDAQIMMLQISPEKVKLLNPSVPSPPLRKDMSLAPPRLACLEWGAFAGDDIARAQSALARFDLSDKVAQRAAGESGWWVFIPPLKTKAEADKKAGEARALGVEDLYVVQDNSAQRFAISLGAFKTEEAANNYLAQLRQKGVRSAAAAPRGVKSMTFVIRDPGDAVTARLAELKVEFPGAALRAAACADATAAPQAGAS